MGYTLVINASFISSDISVFFFNAGSLRSAGEHGYD